MSKSKTIIYYTANKEKESFEKAVVKNILKVKGDIPVISVSQKPMDFGKNICVGELEQNYINAFKQCLIGCKKAKTDFVIMCESDCLYPTKGYFDFEPKKLNTIYTYDNVWLIWNRENRTRFYKHGTTHGSIIYGRKNAIRILERALKNNMKTLYKPEQKWELFHGDPLINIKTRNGISFGTTLTKGVAPKNSFTEWGTVEDIKKKYKL